MPAMSASDRLRALSANVGDGHASLGDIVRVLGDGAVGMLLLALAVPAMVPSPGIPLGAVCGAALVVVGVRLALGLRPDKLPGWLSRRTMPAAAVRFVAERSAAAIARIEALTRPRLRWVSGRAAMPAVGAAVAFLGVLILLPIPFGNTLPALAVAAMAIGLLRRDGAVVLGGACVGVLALGASVALALWAAGLAA